MKKAKAALATVASVATIIAVLAAPAMWAHRHAEAEVFEVADSVVKIQSQSKSYYLMNSAEIELLQTRMELDQMTVVPLAEMNSWQRARLDELTEDKLYWKSRVREIEISQAGED